LKYSIVGLECTRVGGEKSRGKGEKILAEKSGGERKKC
jgi:hypothetical protein